MKIKFRFRKDKNKKNQYFQHFFSLNPLKANELSLNLNETKWTLFQSQKKKHLIANDLLILFIDNFEIVRANRVNS